MDKKGVINLPIVLFSIFGIITLVVLILFLYPKIGNLISRGESVNIQRLNSPQLGLKIEDAHELGNNLIVSVSKNPSEPLQSISFIISNGTGSQNISVPANFINNTETFNLSEIYIANISSIAISPVYSGNVAGKIADIYNISNNFATCVPTTCVLLDYQCGTISNGCGFTLNCGTCGGNDTCTNGVCVSASCKPSSNTIACGTLVCGNVTNNCGGIITCGTCGSGLVCQQGTCVNIQQAQVCSDGTPLNQCSTDKPLYCNGTRDLVNYSFMCGCPSGYYASNNHISCIKSICSDGTPLGQCSTNKPYYCSYDGSLTSNYAICGSTSTSKTNSCSDGTPLNQCSTDKPEYCDSQGNLIDNASLCGCPSGQELIESTIDAGYQDAAYQLVCSPLYSPTCYNGECDYCSQGFYETEDNMCHDGFGNGNNGQGGYEAYSQIGAFTSVTGTFTINSNVSAAPPGNYSAHSVWVGIYNGSDNLVQAGVSTDINPNGIVSYEVFYEMNPPSGPTYNSCTNIGEDCPYVFNIPGNEACMPEIKAGDSVTVTISQVNESSWNIYYKDNTNGQSCQISPPYFLYQTGPPSFALWFVEEWAYYGYAGEFADYWGNISFTNSKVVLNGTTPLNLIQAVAVSQVISNPGPSGVSLNGPAVAFPSFIGSDGMSFNMTRTNTPAPYY